MAIIVQDLLLQPRGFTAFTVRKGQTLRIIDIEGQQVGDVVVFNHSDHADRLSPQNTIVLNRTANLRTGNSLFSTRANKMFTITEDTCGRHDIVLGSCSRYTNKYRYQVDNAPNCRENLARALGKYGIEEDQIPYSFNVFMNSPIQPDETVNILEPLSKAGDYIDMICEMDLAIVGISNCPQERNPCNAFKLKPLRVLVLENK